MPQGRLENENKLNSRLNNTLSSLPDYVRNWNSYLSANGKTAHSRSTFTCIVGEFLAYVGNGNPNIAIKKITKSKVRDYFIEIQTKKTKNGEIKETSISYRRVTYSALNSFFQFLKEDGYIKENYIDTISYPKGNDLVRIKSNRILLTEREFKAILDEARKDKNELYRYRGACILALLMATGMRKSALLSINIEDVDLESNQITVIDKGNKYFNYPIPGNVVNILNEWVEFRKKYLEGKQCNALFISSHKQRIDIGTIDYTVKKYSEKALGKGISPHKIRAGFASINYNNTSDLIFVQRAMGHSYSSTTERYIVTDDTEREKASQYIGSIL